MGRRAPPYASQEECWRALDSTLNRVWMAGDADALADVVCDCLDSGMEWNVNLGLQTALATLCRFAMPLDVVEEVIDAGADLNPPDTEPPLYFALRAGNEPLARLLLRRGACLSSFLLLYSIHDSLAHMVDELVGLGARLDELSWNRDTALHSTLYEVAGRPVRCHVALALIAAGADVLMCSEGDGQIALRYVDEWRRTADAGKRAVYAALEAATAGGEADRVRRVAGHMRRWAWTKRREVVVACAEGMWE